MVAASDFSVSRYNSVLVDAQNANNNRARMNFYHKISE